MNRWTQVMMMMMMMALFLTNQPSHSGIVAMTEVQWWSYCAHSGVFKGVEALRDATPLSAWRKDFINNSGPALRLLFK